VRLSSRTSNVLNAPVSSEQVRFKQTFERVWTDMVRSQMGESSRLWELANDH